MNRCLVCHELFFERVSWRRIFIPGPPAMLCTHCESELLTIKGRRCHGCSRSLDEVKKQHIYGEVCADCWRWQENPLTYDLLEKNRSLYVYNDFLKEWIAIYKFRGDAVAATYFAGKLAILYKNEFTDYVPVEIPLSKERLLSRGFNQSALLMQGWAKETGILSRSIGEKQSKRNRRERVAQVANKPFTLNEERRDLIEGKKIVLVDDIYTTGTTVRQVAQVLIKHGAKKVASITIAR